MARDTTTRGMRDEADVGPSPRAARELKRMSELRYRVADGEPDIRGWRVFASTGRELGTVSDLLVDTDAGEVVMLDVDLRRSDRHTLAPVRAAWIDHATKRVVLDAREASLADAVAAGDPTATATTATTATTAAAPVATRPANAVPDDTDDDARYVPVLPRSGALSDADVRRFNDDYTRAYGDRGAHTDAYRVRRGDEELRFAAGPRRLLDAPRAADTAAPRPMAANADTVPAGRSDEAADINATLADPSVAAARRDAGDSDARLNDPGLLAAAAAADARFAEPAERRADRTDDARDMDDSQAIDPRELDARVRIDEGGTVDRGTPVAGVRYDASNPEPHSYGQPADAYGSGYGDGRIGFDHVSRGPYSTDDPADAAPTSDDRPVRYRTYDDRYAGPADGR